jgi:hypothetical protein
MYRILLTRDGQASDIPSWETDAGNLVKPAEQAIEHLLMERNRRRGDNSGPDGYQIFDEKGELVQSRRVF